MKRALITIMSLQEASEHPDLGDPVQLGATGAYVLPKEDMPEDVGLQLYYPTVTSMAHDLTAVRLLIFNNLRQLQKATVEELARTMGWEGMETRLEQELSELVRLRLVATNGSVFDYVGLYSQLEITI